MLGEGCLVHQQCGTPRPQTRDWRSQAQRTDECWAMDATTSPVVGMAGPAWQWSSIPRNRPARASDGDRASDRGGLCPLVGDAPAEG